MKNPSAIPGWVFNLTEVWAGASLMFLLTITLPRISPQTSVTCNWPMPKTRNKVVTFFPSMPKGKDVSNMLTSVPFFSLFKIQTH